MGNFFCKRAAAQTDAKKTYEAATDVKAPLPRVPENAIAAAPELDFDPLLPIQHGTFNFVSYDLDWLVAPFADEVLEMVQAPPHELRFRALGFSLVMGSGFLIQHDTDTAVQMMIDAKLPKTDIALGHPSLEFGDDGTSAAAVCALRVTPRVEALFRAIKEKFPYLTSGAELYPKVVLARYAGVRPRKQL